MGITATFPAPQSDLPNYLLEDPCIFDLAEAKNVWTKRTLEEQRQPRGGCMPTAHRQGGGQWAYSGIGFVDAALGMSVLLLRFYEVVTVGGHLPEMLRNAVHYRIMNGVFL